jgi:hypothetical protein
VQQAKPFRLQVIGEDMDTRRVSAWPVQTRHQSGFDWIAAAEHDRYGRGGSLGRPRRWVAASRYEHVHPPGQEFGRYCGQLAVLAARPTKLNDYVLAFHQAALTQTPVEGSDHSHRILRRPAAHESDDGHRRLLPARRKRPSGRRPAEERDELAPLHVWMAPAWQEKM